MSRFLGIRDHRPRLSTIDYSTPTMTYETTTTLRPHRSSPGPRPSSRSGTPTAPRSPRRKGPNFLSLRGQGGEEIAITAIARVTDDAGEGLDVVLRSGAGPVLLDSARRGGDCGVSASLPVRVMVEDAWDQVRLELPAQTPVAEAKRRALAMTHTDGDPCCIHGEVPRGRAAGRAPHPGGGGRRAQRAPHRHGPAPPARALTPWLVPRAAGVC